MAMKMTQYGKTKDFRANEESVVVYLERAELYFQANDVQVAKQVPILLSSIGAKTYKLLRSLTAPKAPEEVSQGTVDNTEEPFRADAHCDCRTVPVSTQRAGYGREHSQVDGRAEEADNLLQLWGYCGLLRGALT